MRLTGLPKLFYKTNMMLKRLSILNVKLTSEFVIFFFIDWSHAKTYQLDKILLLTSFLFIFPRSKCKCHLLSLFVRSTLKRETSKTFLFCHQMVLSFKWFNICLDIKQQFYLNFLKLTKIHEAYLRQNHKFTISEIWNLDSLAIFLVQRLLVLNNNWII